jgi:gamma-glutamyltranspeptidase/glutathione hydrolase
MMAPSRPNAMGRNGIVATPHYLASVAGLHILQDGGNAVDAAVAACAALGVVCPVQCGIGGDLFALIHPAKGPGPVVLNASGSAGANATPAFLRAAGHERMPDKGPLAVVTPGCVAGWQAALDRFGTRPLGTLLRYAQSLAEDGFPVDHHLIGSVQAGQKTLNEAAKSTFVPNGKMPEFGDVLRQPDLARTLGRIAEEGPRAMYEGPVGEEIGRYLVQEGGHHTLTDFADYACEWVEPVRADFRGFQVFAPAPNSQGLLYLLALAMLDSLDLGELGGATAIHFQVGAIGYALETARRLIADPRLVDVPTERLLSADHIAAGRARLEQGHLAPVRAASAGDTVYLCAADRAGNLVSMIQSLRQGFGSGVMVPGTGVLLSNRGRDFGLADGDPNQIAPGKRPRHTLSPGMVVWNDRPYLAFGTRGGDTQPFTMLQLACNALAFGLNPQAALDAPRWSAENPVRGPRASTIVLETAFPEVLVEEVAARGHQVGSAADFQADFGTAAMIQMDLDRGILLGGADPRGEGVALAF